MDRPLPGANCAETDTDVRALADYMEAIEQAQSLDRHRVRERASEQFDTDRIVDSFITAVNKARERWGRAGIVPNSFRQRW